MIDPVKFAIEKHGDQTYSNGFPYRMHLAAVEVVLMDFGYREDFWKAVAWLHDTLEDTKTTKEELVDLFGKDIAEVVYAVSGFGKNRKEKMLNICSKVVANKNAAILKIADRIANVESCADSKYGPMYVKERRQFADAVYSSVPQAMITRLERAYDEV